VWAGCHRNAKGIYRKEGYRGNGQKRMCPQNEAWFLSLPSLAQLPGSRPAEGVLWSREVVHLPADFSDADDISTHEHRGLLE
jgi:hypothetical protein